MKKVKITIEGMHCSSCASNVEKSLKKGESQRSLFKNLKEKLITLKTTKNK